MGHDIYTSFVDTNIFVLDSIQTIAQTQTFVFSVAYYNPSIIVDIPHNINFWLNVPETLVTVFSLDQIAKQEQNIKANVTTTANIESSYM